jgi:hypothetical protein
MIDVKAQAGPLSAELQLAIQQSIQAGIAGAAQSMLEWRRLGAPMNKRVEFSGTVTAAQAGLSPATAFFPITTTQHTNRLWSIRQITILAASAGPFAAALANVTAAIYATSQPGQVAAASYTPPNIDAIVTGLTIPTAQFFSSHQVQIRGSDQLVIGVQGTGVTTGLQIFGAVRLLEIDDDPGFLLSL